MKYTTVKELIKTELAGMQASQLKKVNERTSGQYDNFKIYKMTELQNVAKKYEITELPWHFNPADEFFFFRNGEELSDMIVSFTQLADLPQDIQWWMLDYIANNVLDKAQDYIGAYHLKNLDEILWY